VITALLLVAACSKATVENYDRVKAGMTFAEVKQLLGEPTSCDEAVGLRKCVWGDDARHVMVSFAADRVVVYAGKGLK
jgi:hypothetical protein